MERYIRDGKVIEATEKAYRLIYKNQGYLPETEVEQLEETIEEEKNKKKSISKMNKGELLQLASKLDIIQSFDYETATVEEIKSIIKEKIEANKNNGEEQEQ